MLTRDNARDRWVEVGRKHRSPMADDICRRLILGSPVMAGHLLIQGPERAPFNGRFLYGDVHLEWDRILTSERRFAVMAPRGIGKSELFSFVFPIWQAIRGVFTEGLIVLSTHDNAQRVLQKIRDEIESNPMLRWLYPTGRAVRQWNNKQITLSTGHKILARSVLSRIRGMHPGYIIGDDVLSDEAKYSAVYRRKTSDFWFGVLENMPVPSGQLGLVGTPMHRSDIIYGELRSNSGYKHYAFPILDGKGRSLWPEMFPESYIQRQKQVIGSQRFATELMVTPVSDESSMLPRSLLLGAPQEQFTTRMNMRPEDLAPLGLTYFMGVDLAFSASAKADYFVLCVLGVDVHENHWIIAMVRRQAVPYHEQFSLVNEYGRKYSCSRINVESNQAQSILGSELIRKTNLPVKKYAMTAKKHSLDAGFPLLRRMAENMKWRIPRGDKHSIEMTDIIMDEMESFIFMDGKVLSVGEHDDTTSAIFLAVEAAKVGRAFNFGSGTRDLKTKPLPGISGITGRLL